MSVTILVLALAAQSSPLSTVTISNGEMTAVVSEQQGSSRAGSVLELVDVETGIDFAEGGDWGSVHCGDYVPADGTVDKVAPACATFSSPALVSTSDRSELPVAVTATYRLVGRGVEVDYVISATDTADIVEPLEADFGLYPYLDCFIKYANQTVDCDRTNALTGQHEVFRISGDQEIILYGPTCPVDTRFFFPNPSKAFIGLSAEAYPENEYLSMRFFDTDPPRSSATGPDLHSRLGPGNESRYHIRMAIEDDQVPIYFSNHPNSWERTASWIFDEIPHLHPSQGYMWDYSETSSDSEWVSAALIQLLEDHPTMNMNILVLPDGILADNCDSMWYEPGHQDSWSHWHSTWRVSTEAPEDYKQWMRNIQNDVYPWADRVNLGCHGYHHTPSPDSAWDPYHEFITYEPEEHQERFDMIQSDYADIGLDVEMTSRTLRPSGNESSLSGVWAMIDHGFEYLSNGTRWNEWEAGEWFWDLYLTKYETPNGRMWGANTVWWGDYNQMMDYERLITVMERGKHGLLGGHPIAVVGASPGVAYDRIDSLCTSLEQDYDNFGWIMPVHFSDLMEELYQLKVDSLRCTSNSASIHFHGATGSGQTVVCRAPDYACDIDATVDGSPAEFDLYDGNRVFVDVDGLSSGGHVATVVWQNTGVESSVGSESVGLSIRVGCPASGRIPVSLRGLEPESSCRLRLFDMAGRAVAEAGIEADGSGSAFLEMAAGSDLPAGTYVLAVSSAGSTASAKTVLLPR